MADRKVLFPNMVDYRDDGEVWITVGDEVLELSKADVQALLDGFDQGGL
jgi:hypothetical protein